MRNGNLKNKSREIGIFRQIYRRTANQWEQNSNSEAVYVFAIKRIASLTSKLKKGLVKQEELLACQFQFYGVQIFYTRRIY
jgi:hypothetical protein